MSKTFKKEEYHKQLSKKQVGTAVIFFNNEDKILIVKPNYRESWLTPGGSVDEGESPLACATRETKEEIGLNITNLQLVGVYHSTGKGMYPDSLKFIFNGGILSDEQIANIQLQTEELEEYTFKSIPEALPLLSNSLQKSIPNCLKAMEENTVVCI